jgi:hypothetical protein
VEAVDDSGAVFTIGARHVLDASGRVGVLARRYRLQDGPPTLAVSAAFRRPGGFDLPDASHTLVERHAEGWVWSVPLAPGQRHVTAMADPPPRGQRPRDPAALFAKGLAHSPHARRLVESAEPIGSPWADDASTYTASAFAGARWALVGDAGSFIDPLSSFGVKKALFSAWLAAVFAHTALTAPDRALLAASFFDREERRVYRRYARETAAYALEAGQSHPGSAFWRARGSAFTPAGRDEGAERTVPDQAVREAFEQLRARRRIRLVPGEGVCVAPAPAVVGREIALRDAVVPREGEPLHFVEGIEAARLLRLAAEASDVGALLEAYGRESSSEAPVGRVLRGLSTLLAAGLLRSSNS